MRFLSDADGLIMASVSILDNELRTDTSTADFSEDFYVMLIGSPWLWASAPTAPTDDELASYSNSWIIDQNQDDNFCLLTIIKKIYWIQVRFNE